MRSTHGLIAVALAMSLPASAAAAPSCIVPELGSPLAGKHAVDCGIAPSGHRRERARVAKCARKQIERGTPVRFGVGVMGVDAFSCDVVAVDADRRVWHLTYHWDANTEDAPLVFAGRCAGIDPGLENREGGDAFLPRDCVFDQDAFERAGIHRP